MAGHSKFKNIMHRKGRQDAARSKLFSRLSKEITVAVKMGGGVTDPDMNPRLRLAMQNAKGQSMPKDNIERAINKATGGDAENYDEIRYEGYGPGGVAVMVECMTDNRNRTVADVRHAFTKYGGNLGNDGSVAYMFTKVGLFTFPAGVDEDAVMEPAIEAGAEDVESDEELHVIYTADSDLNDVSGPNKIARTVKQVRLGTYPMSSGLRVKATATMHGAVTAFGMPWKDYGCMSHSFDNKDRRTAWRMELQNELVAGAFGIPDLVAFPGHIEGKGLLEVVNVKDGSKDTVPFEGICYAVGSKGVIVMKNVRAMITIGGQFRDIHYAYQRMWD